MLVLLMVLVLVPQADLFCTRCHSLLGWTYLSAVEASERYKVGKFILEKAKFCEQQQQAL